MVENKKELFEFLSKAVISFFEGQDKEVIATAEEKVLCIPPQNDLTGLEPCCHEEADTRLRLHIKHTSENQHKKILIRTVDTDVIVRAIMASQTLPLHSEIWVAFGSGNRFRSLPAHDIAVALGREKSAALPLFHALTGCDTVSAFVGYGKKSAWSTWRAFPELTSALLFLTSTPDQITDECMCLIERFVILMYDRTSTCTEVNGARCRMFPKKKSPNAIPPSHAALALEQHIRRATYQSGHIWGQTLVPSPKLPSHVEWSWLKPDAALYEQKWATLPKAAKACYERICCGCKKGCRFNCRCKKAALKCTGLSFCGGDCCSQTPGLAVPSCFRERLDNCILYNYTVLNEKFHLLVSCAISI